MHEQGQLQSFRFLLSLSRRPASAGPPPPPIGWLVGSSSMCECGNPAALAAGKGEQRANQTTCLKILLAVGGVEGWGGIVWAYI